ncbi:VWA domain-containing protein [Demequina sp. SYSU T00068]|uniref:vWA domain-containing protein n=1 Tax=Demequina lignilytica TaxID=3051663 RepID=UPI00262BCB0C|nr:VWA domain-containing protein [Demequina sp. SYSU T00068]MDN4489698.1 VWA domain-containing protein [Demequina sp. SYSU T00068]
MALDIGMQDLIENNTLRVPVALCIDTSTSMAGDKINELAAGIELFVNAVDEDEEAHDAVELCIVEFNDGAGMIAEFAGIDRLQERPIRQLEAGGMTYMGEGVNMALDALDRRKAMYRDTGVQYNQPWLVLMTDGKPNGSPQELTRAVQRVNELVAGRKLSVFAIAIGADASMDALAMFSPRRDPMRLQGIKFREFFEWLSKSVSQASGDAPGDDVTPDPDVSGWKL